MSTIKFNVSSQRARYSKDIVGLGVDFVVFIIGARECFRFLVKMQELVGVVFDFVLGFASIFLIFRKKSKVGGAFGQKKDRPRVWL